MFFNMILPVIFTACYLFGFVLLMVPWRHQAVTVDALVVDRRAVVRVGAAPLHHQEGANGLDLALEAAVGQRLAFGAQSAGSHPLSVLLLLQDARRDRVREREEEGAEDGRLTDEGVRPHVIAAQVDLIHAVGCWHQQSDEELLCCHVNVWSNLAP